MKKPLFISALSFVVVLVLLFSLSLGAFAAPDVNELKDKKQDIDAQIKDKKGELDSNKSSQDTAHAQLDTINTNLDNVRKEIDKITADLGVAEENLANQQVEYESIKATLEASQAELRTRLCAIYRNGDVSYLDVIFSSENIEDFISGFIFLTKIVEQDQSIINTIQENKLLAEEKLKELETIRNQILALQEQKEAEEAEYKKQVDAKVALLGQLEAEQEALEEELEEMEKQSSSIAAEINSYYASLASTDVGYAYTGTGIFGWPLSIQGRVSSNFGYRIHPISGSRRLHAGVDIAAPAGTPILAAEDGTVIRVQTISTGYGHNVIIAHGSNIVTLYGHMSSINVSAGQYVSRGQKIGGVGTTGASTGNHLHFEVRVNGSPTNPFAYISP